MPILKQINRAHTFPHVFRIHFNVVTVLDSSTKGLFMMGLYYSQIFNTAAEFDSRLSKHAKSYLSERPFYSNFAIPCVSQETPATGLSQAGFSTQLKTALRAVNLLSS
jgi:hypothetical protein